MAFKLNGWSAFKKPESQDFMGKNQLFNRLTSQVGNKDLAKNILIDRGHMNSDGTLTQEGELRDNMTAEERAIDRASKESGKPKSSYIYDKEKNKAKLS
tara:strand:- start:993 stop:1289 length:297 start_codon:yes stop_codon:yes gene_type:complete